MCVFVLTIYRFVLIYDPFRLCLRQRMNFFNHYDIQWTWPNDKRYFCNILSAHWNRIKRNSGYKHGDTKYSSIIICDVLALGRFREHTKYIRFLALFRTFVIIPTKDECNFVPSLSIYCKLLWWRIILHAHTIKCTHIRMIWNGRDVKLMWLLSKLQIQEKGTEKRAHWIKW